MLKRVYTANFLFAFTLGLAAYINSSFLEKTISKEAVGLVFSFGSILALIILELLPTLLVRFGNRKVSIASFIVSIIGLSCILLFPSTPIMLWLAFFMILPTNYVIGYCFDVYAKHYQGVSKAGTLRGSYLSISNAAWLFAPLVAGILIDSYGFFVLFGLITIIRLINLLYQLRSFETYEDIAYVHETPLQSIAHVLRDKNLTLISIVNFSLQLFYVWMILFTPLFLKDILGLSYENMGLIFTFMLLPFVLLEYPLGVIADRFLGEKELLSFGLLCMALAVFLFGKLSSPYLIVIALVLFATRIGAATTEVMSETYFFSKIKEKNTGVLSFFRVLPTIAYILGPLSGILIIKQWGYRGLFTILALILVIVTLLIQKLKDTK